MSDIRQLLGDLSFAESPRWHNGALWFSEMFQRQVLRLSETGRPEVMATLDDRPCGLGWLPDGRLLVVGMDRRRVLRREPDGTLAVHADLSELTGAPINDLFTDAHGRAYVTGVGFDIARWARNQDADAAEPMPGSIFLVEADGRAREVAGGLRLPNGLEVTPDGRTLIVAETFGARLSAFTMAEDGSLGPRWTWAEVPGAAPDGIALTPDGCVWVANALANECLLLAGGGEVLERVRVPVGPAYACTIGTAGTLIVLAGGQAFDRAAALTERQARVFEIRRDQRERQI
jgi:sugar lactone lactonase YvrE